MIRREYKTFGFCCGLGGGAKGFKKAASQVGNMVATWKCIGGIDVDPAAVRTFERLVGVKCTVMDLYTTLAVSRPDQDSLFPFAIGCESSQFRYPVGTNLRAHKGPSHVELSLAERRAVHLQRQHMRNLAANSQCITNGPEVFHNIDIGDIPNWERGECAGGFIPIEEVSRSGVVPHCHLSRKRGSKIRHQVHREIRQYPQRLHSRCLQPSFHQAGMNERYERGHGDRKYAANCLNPARHLCTVLRLPQAEQPPKKSSDRDRYQRDYVVAIPDFRHFAPPFLAGILA